LYGSHCLSVVGLIRVGWSPLAVGRFRPSQWRRGVRTVPWWGRVRVRRYADCGQLMAGSTSRPARLSQYPRPVSAPLGALWAAIPEGAGPWAIARGAGFPCGPAAAPRPSPLGCGPRAR
jgi:hypothetical protein